MHNLFRIFIPSFLQTEDDATYWDKKATERNYLAALYRGEVDPASPGEELPSLYERALAASGPVNFDRFLQGLDVNPSYVGLTKAQMELALGMGILGVLAAYATNLNAQAIKTLFEKVHSHYKLAEGSSPIDYRSGADHRQIFGHDFNPWQRLPEGYTVGGIPVGGKSLYTLILEQMRVVFPGSSAVATHMNAVLHILTHYLSDLPTTQGLPLPFTSVFTQWAQDVSKASGYQASNPIADALGKEYGSINAADVASYTTVKLLLLGHHAVVFHGSEACEHDRALHFAQMSTLAYGAAIAIQMMLLACGVAGRTGKLNYLIAVPFLSNATKAILLVNRGHGRVMQDYSESLAILNDSSSNLDEWVKHQCA